MKVTKWSIFNGELTVSEQAEQISGESGSLNAGVSHLAATPSEPVAASVAESSPAVDAQVQVSEPSMPEPSMSEPSLFESATSEAPPVEAPKAGMSASASQPEPSRSEASRPEISHPPGKVQAPGKVIVMPRGDRAWADNDTRAGPEDTARHGVFGTGRIAAMAAVVALATAAGAVGGALATSAFMHGGGSQVAASASQTSLEASVSRIDSDIQALKSGLEHTSKLGMSQFNKTSDRLDKLERAQAEPSAKIAKLSEAVDRLRAAAAPAVAAATTAVPKETTGSISAAQAAPTAAVATQQAGVTPPKSEVGRLPTVDGWVLRDVAQGGALIDGRRGIYEVYAGDFIPGLGRIDAIRRQDGRWVVVTSKGLIVARQ
jgi:hypothetical protein